MHANSATINVASSASTDETSEMIRLICVQHEEMCVHDRLERVEVDALEDCHAPCDSWVFVCVGDGLQEFLVCCTDNRVPDIVLAAIVHKIAKFVDERHFLVEQTTFITPIWNCPCSETSQDPSPTESPTQSPTESPTQSATAVPPAPTRPTYMIGSQAKASASDQTQVHYFHINVWQLDFEVAQALVEDRFLFKHFREKGDELAESMVNSRIRWDCLKYKNVMTGMQCMANAGTLLQQIGIIDEFFFECLF
jgi:hypothetical protein